MAITYVSNPLITKGNFPLDARTTVTTFAEMPNIEYPFVGMQVYVIEEEATYLINQDCLVSDGDGGFDINPDINELKNYCIKILTSDNIGLAGPGIEKRYCLGTENEPKYELIDKTVREPYGWDTMRPTPTELLPFVWSIEAQIIWNSDEQAYTALGPDGWSSPMRENGEPGTGGKDFAILGTYDDLATLKAAVTNPSAGDAYAIGTAAPYDIYIWDALNNEWVNHGAIQGAKGDPGDPAWKSITKFIFHSTAGQSDPLATPPTPTGGSYDFETGAFNTPNNWQIIDSSLEKPIWMSSKVFAEDAAVETDWDEPIMISGIDGSAGEDGVGIEYAYKRAKSEAEAPTDKPGEITEGGNDGNGWWDNPQGVDSTWTCEYVSIRTGNDSEWAEWNEPSLWSKYGANGQDGDGVEYIYYINTLNNVPANPTPNNYTTIEDYNQSEWLPNKMGDSYVNNGGVTISIEDANNWSDNPHGVDKTNKFEYVATRKKVNGTWGAFSEPKLWSTFAEDGEDGETTLLAILDNPMDTVLLDANGNVSTGLPISTNFHVYEGTEELVVKNLTYSVPDDADINSDYITVTAGTSSNPYANFTMKEGSIRNTISTKIPVTLQGTVDIKGKDVVYHTTFLINKISAAAPNIIIDFANDNINIAADEDGVATTLTANNYINAFKGLDELTVESVLCDDSNVTCDYLGNNEVKVTLAKFDTDTYNVLLNVNAKDDEDNVYTRSASFRLIKVKAGMPGEPAIFFEIKPNLRVIKTNSSGNIADSSKTLTATVVKHTGAAIEEFELSNKPDNIIVYYDVDGDSLDTIMPDTGLNISNAITGDLDLDRYICLSLYDSNSTSVIDKERIYMVHDGAPGEDGVGYKLVASSVVIAKEYNGTVKNTEDTTVSLVKIEGEELINVTSIPEAYELRRYVDGVGKVINSLPDTISTDAMASIEDNVRYELWYVQTGTKVDGFIADSVTISVIKDAQPGVDGRMMYFAGEFNINESGESEIITYVVDDTTVPYVYDDSGRKSNVEDAPIYFYLGANSYSSTITPYNDYKAGNDNWRPITSMDVLYSKIGMFDTANVGPAVFYKKWVFSQKDINGKTSYNTFDGDPINGVFKPAMWFNFETGEGSLAKGNIYWDESGEVTFKSKIDATQLNTRPETNASNVVIEGNAIAINDSNSQTICLFSDNSLGLSSNNAFQETSSNSEIYNDWASDSILGTVGYFYTPNTDITGDINAISSIEKEIGYLTSGQIVRFEWRVPTTVDLTDRLTSATNKISISKYIGIDVYCDGTLVDTIGATTTSSSSASGSSSSKIMISVYNGSIQYTTPKNGTYSFKPKVGGSYSGNLSTSGEVKQIVEEAVFEVTYGNSNTTCLTSICKDGMIVKNASNGIFMGDNVIMFKIGDYGLKLSSAGITYATNLTTYQDGNLDQANWQSLL